MPKRRKRAAPALPFSISDQKSQLCSPPGKGACDQLLFQFLDQPFHLCAHEGRLLLAGPCPAIDAEDPGPAGFSGSIVIAEFTSIEQARAWADADPYVAAGVYARVDVRPFKRVLP